MKHILFVDDDLSILNGLRRSLRGQRGEWQMEFVEGGEHALQLMRKQPFDAVVTDMRMPGMDGNELLKQVADEYPQTIRFLLSGQSDEERILRSTEIAHQYFAKPCPIDALQGSLRRALVLKDRLQDEQLQSFVSGLTSLPCIPDVYLEIRAALQKTADVSLREIGQLVKGDPAMSAKILQLVNSAFFGLRRQMTDVGDAVVYIGLNTFRSLVLSVGVFSQFDPKAFRNPPYSLALLWNHCTMVATGARRIAKAERASKEVTDYSFLAGLLHDIGILIMEQNCCEKYGEAGRLVNDQRVSLQRAEQETFGTTHSAVGAYLLGLWSLPVPVVEAVALHHEPAPSRQKGFSPLVALHVADILTTEEMPDTVSTNHTVDTAFLAEAGLTDKLAVWKSLLSAEDA